MYTVIRGGEVLGEDWEREAKWILFHDLVREEGTERSFARFPTPESALVAASKLGGSPAEVVVPAPGDKFEIVLYRGRPAPKIR